MTVVDRCLGRRRKVCDGLQLLRSRRGGRKGAQKCAIKEAEMRGGELWTFVFAAEGVERQRGRRRRRLNLAA